jgi:hypothetical protein
MAHPIDNVRYHLTAGIHEEDNHRTSHRSCFNGDAELAESRLGIRWAHLDWKNLEHREEALEEHRKKPAH